MAYRLSVIFGVSTKELVDTLILFLERNTRPMFEEDVGHGYIPLFEAIELLEFPASIGVVDGQVVVDWFEVDDLDISDFSKLSNVPGIEFIAAYEISDDPMSEDEGNEDWFWIRVDGKFMRVGSARIGAYLKEDVINLFQDRYSD